MYWRAQWRRCDENERTNEATKKTQTRNEKPSQKRNKAKISKNEKKKKNLRRIRRNRDDWRLPVPIHYTICRRIHFSFALNFYATRPMLTVYLFISLTLLRSFDLVPRVCLCVCVCLSLATLTKTIRVRRRRRRRRRRRFLTLCVSITSSFAGKNQQKPNKINKFTKMMHCVAKISVHRECIKALTDFGFVVVDVFSFFRCLC